MKTSIIAAGLLGFLWVSCRPEVEVKKTKEVAIPVKTATVQQKAYARPIVTSGILLSDKEAKLSFKVSGILTQLRVQEGDLVRKGQVLATLDQTEIAAQVAQAQTGFEKAQRDYHRELNLFNENAATREELENAKSTLEVARQALQVARFNQQHATIYANQSGRVLQQFANGGEMVEAGQPVYTINSTSEGDWVIETGLSDKDWARLQPGDKATITTDAYPDKTFPAVVSQQGQAADPATGTFLVKLKVRAEGVRLASGLTVKAQIFPSQAYLLQFIPIEALTEVNQNTGSVYAVGPDGKSVVRHQAKIAFITDNQAAIEQGLENVQAVITDGVSYLSETSTIQLSR